ncbi:hypothetical protein J2S74_002630 [Evansella vedderi]|uniref:DUF1798 family protein n=1 Tax=Evansella vedderi TaxID=38282 RepID=A0ABT9ZXP5_9BACI|nr:YppE family protein [Evansella vedderi]MDQ0255248.1 hypothetical protein [Evansella vedderi]
MENELPRLEELTEKLLEKNTLALQYFEFYTLQGESADFQTIVHPFADEVKKLSDEWMELALSFVKREKPKYLYHNQVDNAHENLQIQAVACFQKDTKRKRFLERNKSIEYTLESLLKLII